MGPITQSQIDAYRTLTQFKDFADSTLNDDAVAQFNAKRGVFQAKGDAVRGVFKVWKAPLGRDVDVNNLTRSTFKSAVLKLFNATTVKQLPKDVQDAITSGSLGSSEKSGKPLSARRITAVMNAVKNQEDFLDVRAAALGAETEKLLSPAREGCKQTFAALKDNLVAFLQNVGPDRNLNMDSDLKVNGKTLADLINSVADRGARSTADLREKTKNFLEQLAGNPTSADGINAAYANFKAEARKAYMNENGIENPDPRADSRVTAAMNRVFALTDQIVNRVKLRQAMIEGLQNAELAGKSEAGRIRDIGMLESRVLKALENKNESRDISQIAADEVKAYCDACNSAKDRMDALGDKLKNAYGMSAEQSEKFDSLAKTFLDASGGSLRSDSMECAAGVFACLALDCDSLPGPADGKNADADLKKVSSQVNSTGMDRLIHLAKGKEESAAQLLSIATSNVARYVLVDPTRFAAVFPKGAAPTRETLYRAVMAEGELPRNMKVVTDAEFISKSETTLLYQLRDYGSLRTAGKYDTCATTTVATGLFGALGPMLKDIDLAIDLLDMPRSGVVLTERDVAELGGIYNLNTALRDGREGLIKLLTLDIARCGSVVSIGGEKFDFEEVFKITDEKERTEKSREMAGKVLASLENFCGKGNEGQILILGYALTQAGNSVEKMCPLGGMGDHVSHQITLTRDPQGGDVRIAKHGQFNPKDSARDLKYGYLVKPDGSSEMTHLRYEAKPTSSKGVIGISSFRKLIEDGSMSDDRHVYIANEDRTDICFNASGSRPKGFVKPSGTQLEDGSRHIRRELVRVAREMSGGRKSPAFLKVLEKLSGPVGASGKLNVDKLKSPLTKGEIKEVFKILDDELRTRLDPNKLEDIAKYNNLKGNYVTVGTGADGDSAQPIRDFLKNDANFPGLKSEYDLTGGYRNNPAYWNNFFLGGIAGDGLGSIATSEDKMPTTFRKDRFRSSYFSVGGKKLVPRREGGAGYVTGVELNDELARFVTKNPEAKFDELEGKDLKRVQLMMSIMCQSTMNAIFMPMRTELLGDFDIGPAPQSPIYTVKDDGAGGLVFSSVAEMDVALVRDALGQSSCKCDGTKSFFCATAEFGYSKERLDEICDHDWTWPRDKKAPPPDLSYIEPSTFNLYATAHFDA